MNLKTALILVIVGLPIAAFASNATFHFSFVGDHYAGGQYYQDYVIASGLLYTTTTSTPDVYLVQGATGIGDPTGIEGYLGKTITGVFDPDPSGSNGYFLFNNLLYYPTSTTNSQYVDNLGILFQLSPPEPAGIYYGVNIYSDAGGYLIVDLTDRYGVPEYGQLSITPVAAPEPTTLFTLGAGILGLAGVLRKHLLS